MKKIVFTFMIICLFIITPAVLAQNPRVQCSNLSVTIEMEAPSENAECLTVMNSESAPQGASLMQAKISSAAVVLNDYRRENKISPEAAAFTINGLSAVNAEIYQKAVDITNMLNAANSGGGIGAISAPIPFLPYQDKTQLLVALPELINFESVSAVRFITAYGDPGNQVSNNNLFYTVQGVTQDGKYYLSITIPISSPQLSAPVDPATFDWNSIGADSWQPSLNELDQLTRSIRFN